MPLEDNAFEVCRLPFLELTVPQSKSGITMQQIQTTDVLLIALLLGTLQIVNETIHISCYISSSDSFPAH